MSLRPTLERERERYRLPTGAFDRLVVARERRRRRERVVAIALSIAIAAFAIGAAAAVFRAARTGEPAEPSPTAITPRTVGRLRVAWRAPLPHQSGPMVVSDGVVVSVTDMEGLQSGRPVEIEAFPTTGCDRVGATCAPMWTAAIPESGLVPNGPAVAGGMVFVPGDRLYAYPLRCRTDGGICAPSWTGTVGDGAASQPVVDGTNVYVATYSGSVYAFPLSCDRTVSAGGRCAPAWRSPSVGLPLLASAVYRDRLFVSVSAQKHTPHLNRIYTFDTSCRATCGPMATDDVPGQNFASMPTLSDGILYVGTAVDGGTGALQAYDASCGLARACRLWSIEEREALNIPNPVAADGEIITAARFSTYRVRAYAAGPTAPAAASWSSCCIFDISDATPAAEGGVAFVTSETGGVTAYPTRCRPDANGFCKVAWTWSGSPSGLNAAAAGGGVLVVAERDGGLVAFTVGPSHGASTPAGHVPEAVVYAGAALVLATTLLRRVRRRPLRLRRA